MLLETTESPAQQRGNQQDLQLHRALPSDGLRITFYKLLAGWVYFSLPPMGYYLVSDRFGEQDLACFGCQLPAILPWVLYTPETQMRGQVRRLETPSPLQQSA